MEKYKKERQKERITESIQPLLAKDIPARQITSDVSNRKGGRERREEAHRERPCLLRLKRLEIRFER